MIRGMQAMAIVTGMLGAYLVGAIPFSFLIARGRGVDLRTAGSGNIGATNVFRTVGRGWGIAALAADVLKGFLPAWGFPRWTALSAVSSFSPFVLGLLCGLAAVVGHTWPVYLRFRGGKGVATSAGVLLGIAPGVIGVGAAAWAGLFLLSGYVSLASVGAAVFVVMAGWAWRNPEQPGLALALTLMGLLVVVRHRGNLARLWAGTERRALWARRAETSA